MKSLFLFLALFSFGAQASITIISDLDDTIKITNAADLKRATYNGIFRKRVYTGMPEFLNEARSYSNALHVVTASPSVIRPRVNATLAAHDIEADGVYLRNVFREGKHEFKVRVIKDIMAETSDNVILIGDDVDKDPEIYQQIQQSFPERVLGVYIHIVRNREVPAGMTRYWTSFDLALREFLAGRMALPSVKKVGESLLQASKLSRIFPKFAHCPSDASIFEWQLQTIFLQEAQELTEKLKQYCLARGGKGSL